MTSEEKSFLQNILENRFVKFTIPYAIGAWGFVQVAAFLESRYSWAEGWPDFIVVLFLVMLPSVLLFSYFRGKSSDQLVKTEKIFFPINLLLALALAFFGFGKSDLNATPAKVAVIDEEGQEIERLIPHHSSSRRVTLLPWDNQLNDPEARWMSYTLPQILGADLEQDQRLISITPRDLAADYNEYNAKLNVKPPFSIQRKIASDQYSDYFLDGSIKKEGDNYQVTTTLFNTKDGKEFYSKEYKNADPLTIIDQISEDFRNEVYVENELEDDFIDLPVSNLFTNSLEALKYFGQSLQQAYYSNNKSAAADNATKAINIDPNFAMANFYLCEYLVQINKVAESKAAITRAMEMKDMLNERMQFEIKVGYMTFESLDKALALLEMWSQLYPRDFKPYNLLMMLYDMRSEAEKSRQTALRALENGHTGSVLLKLAKLENAQGNQEEAKKYYQQFEKEFPHKAKNMFGEGNIYMSTGEFDKAQEHFEKLHLLNPDKSNILAKLAEIQGKKGNFQKQLSLYDDALRTEKQFLDSIRTMQKKEMVYLNLGQIDRYFEEMNKRWQLMTRISPYNQIQFEKTMPYNVKAIIDQGKGEGLLDTLLAITRQLDNSFVDFNCVAMVNYYLAVEDKEQLNKAMDTCEEAFKKIQTEVQMNVVYALVAKVNKDYKKAIEYLEAVQSGSKLDDSLLWFFGEIYRLDKQYDQAERQLKATLKIDPYNTNLLYQLALTYHEQSKDDLARSTMQKALDIWKNADANFQPANQAKERLASWN